MMWVVLLLFFMSKSAFADTHMENYLCKVFMPTTQIVVRRGRSTHYCASSVIVDKKRGLVLSNAHAVFYCNGGNYFLHTKNGSSAEARVVLIDRASDLAALQVDPAFLEDYEEIAGFVDDVYVGMEVFTINNSSGGGFIFGKGLMGGSDTSFQRMNIVMESYSAVGPLNFHAGSSGSPLLSRDKKLVGMVFQGSRNCTTIIPSYQVKKFVERAKKRLICEDDGITSRALRGYEFVYEDGSGLVEMLGPSKHLESHKRYLYIQRIFFDPCEIKHSHPLEVGDVVLQVNGKKNPTLGDVYRASLAESGATITVYRSTTQSVLDMPLPVYTYDAQDEKALHYGGKDFWEMWERPLGEISRLVLDSCCNNLYQWVCFINGKSIHTLDDLLPLIGLPYLTVGMHYLSHPFNERVVLEELSIPAHAQKGLLLSLKKGIGITEQRVVEGEKSA
ncbi:MAG: serine protease [Alphaproteobacteria bacterium]|nr:serine protease [Alphaproteobacteria bacterium]